MAKKANRGAAWLVGQNADAEVHLLLMLKFAWTGRRVSCWS